MLVQLKTCVAHLTAMANNIMYKNAFVFVSLLLLTSASHAAWEQPELGHELTALPAAIAAPDFTLTDMDDETHRLADYRGKVILLNFWATWCPPCRREMPSMERLHQNLHQDNFVVIAINQMETPDHVFAYTGQQSEVRCSYRGG